MLAALSNFTNAIYNTYNSINATHFLETAKNVTATLAQQALKSSQFQQREKTPSLEEKTIEVLSDTTEQLLTTTETGKHLASTGTRLSNEISKMLQQTRVRLLQKINGVWVKATQMYKELSTEVVKDVKIIRENIAYAAETVSNTTESIKLGFVGYIRQGLNITPGNCYVPLKNATLIETCIYPPINCLKNMIGFDPSCCKSPEPICLEATAQQIAMDSWSYFLQKAKEAGSFSINALGSAAYTVGQTALSASFSLHPALGYLPQPPKGNSNRTLSSWGTINLASAVAHVYTKLFKDRENPILKSASTGTFIGSTAAFLWGQDPVLGGIQGAVAQTWLDWSAAKAALYLPPREKINQIMHPWQWNLAPLGAVISGLVGLRALEENNYLKTENYISTASSIFLLTGTSLYAMSESIRYLTLDSMLPVAYLSIYPAISTAAEWLREGLTSTLPPGSELLIYGTTGALLAGGAYLARALPHGQRYLRGAADH